MKLFYAFGIFASFAALIFSIAYNA